MGRIIASEQPVRMKRKVSAFLLLVFWLAVYPADGQTPVSSIKETTKVQRKNLEKFVDALRGAFAGGDYEKLANLFFIPKDFTADDSDAEGREKGIAIIKQMIEQTKIAGIRFTVQIETPQNIVRIGDKLFSIVPQKTFVVVGRNSAIKNAKGQKIPAGQYEASGYLLAISNDGGEGWRFWNEVSKENLEREFPETNGKIKLPEIKKPDFLR